MLRGILAVAEAFDVMTSDQPYREKVALDVALNELTELAGKQFDPGVVKALRNIDVSGD